MLLGHGLSFHDLGFIITGRKIGMEFREGLKQGKVVTRAT